MTLLTQSVITEEDIVLNHMAKYVKFMPMKNPVLNLVKTNHLVVRYKKYLSSLSEDDFYQEDTEEKGLEKMKEDFKNIEDKLRHNEIVIYSPRECFLVENELIEFSTEKIRRFFVKEFSRLHNKYYNKLNFWM
tara:strand:- start:839 stop:1237 length:399 start_codon:yes stop_codon:yes gene_type:complete